MTKLNLLAAFSFTLIAVRLPAAPLAPLYPEVEPICPCESLKNVSLPNTTIESAVIDPTDGSCRVTAIVTHPPAGDRIKVWIGLPTKKWNGRFRGTGGGAFQGGNENSLQSSVGAGWVVGATNAGHEGGNPAFALDEKGRLNWQAIVNFAYLGIHEMTVVGKALTKAFYGKPPRYSYFISNSTGGRQGIVEAERYPEDYDGVVVGCPAINWNRFLPVLLWPYALMNDAGNQLPKEKFEAVTAAAVAACDEGDGVKDGIIGEPWRRSYDPQAFVGTKVGNDTFTAADAEIIRKIWQGPRGRDGAFLWYGPTPGTPIGRGPHGAGMGWFQYFLEQDPQWDYKTLTRDGFELRFQQSLEQYGAIFGNENPDLTGFRDRGGKLLVYHGMADESIPVYGSIHYFRGLQRRMGGEAEVAKFARLFLAPGVTHGLNGPGPAPTGYLDAIFDWVEKGKAPEMLLTEQRSDPKDFHSKIIRRRPLFPFPNIAKYKGSGNPDEPENFVSQPGGPYPEF